MSLAAIGFDADDTLWQNEQFFKLTEARFASLLESYAEPGELTRKLLEFERRNLEHYGYGIKGFTLSMIETAIEITQGRVPAAVIYEILAAGREMLSHPVETLPHVRETLAHLVGRYRIILITKGDLFDQERKLAQSGLGELFDDVLPAIEAGSWAVHVPHDLTWALEHADEPAEAPRFRRLRHLGELTALLDEIA